MTTRSAHPAARFRPSAIASLLTLAGVLLAAAPALGGATGIANVTFQWTDRVGGTHVMKDVWVTGEEIDPSYNDPAGSGYTNSAGVFVFTGADPEPFQSTTEFSGTVESYLGSGATENARVRSGVGGGIYWQPWPLPAGTTFDV